MKHNIDLAGANWSTGRSGSEGQCVEVATVLPQAPGYVAVRHSTDPAGPVLTFTDAEWDKHLLSVRDGLYDK